MRIKSWNMTRLYHSFTQLLMFLCEYVNVDTEMSHDYITPLLTHWCFCMSMWMLIWISQDSLTPSLPHSSILTLPFVCVKVTSWNHNCSEVSQLLHQLNKNCDSMESITKCSRSPHMSSLFAMFPDLNEKLIGNIIVENEDICIQLKVFM
jgi:hypothetical protein